LLNQVNISGRLARDPETRSVGNSTVTNFTLGVSEKYKDRQTGEQKEKTAWVRVVAWGKTGEIAAEASKGDEVVITGKLETRTWEDKDKNKRESTEVNAFAVFVIGKRNAQKASAKPKGDPNPFDDEIPF
jgi:single-strand DNA-binding protein